MIDNRDMYYGGYVPMDNMANMGGMPIMNMANPGNGQMQMMPNNYATGQFNDMNERINRLERQVKRLDQRLTRLETPYANNMKYNNEPDNNMYMM